jgi:hypothetical protein
MDISLVFTPEFTPEFFDKSSEAWLLNKNKHKGGSYSYKCLYIHSNGKHCKSAVESTYNARRQYSRHPEWDLMKKSESPDTYCIKHRLRGPFKESLNQLGANIHTLHLEEDA